MQIKNLSTSTSNQVQSSMKNHVIDFFKKYYSIFVILFIGFVGWFFKLTNFSIVCMAIACMLFFVFTDDPKHLLTALFSFPAFIFSCYEYLPYALSAGITIFGMVYYTIKMVFVKKIPIRKGKMFWGFVALTLAFSLGGIIGNFRIIYFLIVFGLCLAGYYTYWLVINFSKDLKNFFNISIISIGLVLIIQFLIGHAMLGSNIFQSIAQKSLHHIGEQNINNVAVYFGLSMIACLQLAFKNKKDYLYCLFAVLFAVFVFLTYSRMCTLVALVLLLVGGVFVYAKSSNKKIFNITFISIFAILLCIFVPLIIFDKIRIFDWYINLGVKDNGRFDLWSWCLEQFKSHPIFGIGMYSEELLPVVHSHKVIADNIFVQYLVSTGIVGSFFALCFYIFKYKVSASHFNSFKFFNILSILLIALNGITSQAPTTDFMMVMISIVLIALAELDTDSQIEGKIENKTFKLNQNKSRIVATDKKNKEKTNLKTNLDKKWKNLSKKKRIHFST